VSLQACDLQTAVSHDGPVNALTIDFEDWYQGLEIPVERWRGFEDRIEETGRRLLRLFADHGVRATFFVLGWVAERHPWLIRDIAAAGHEIATHGWSHTMVHRQTLDQFRGELSRSIDLLAKLAGEPILGFRAPFFSITQASLSALGVMSDLGIRYDSSIFPVINDRYGIPGAERWPHRVTTDHSSIVEFPISTWRVAGGNVPIAGGAYFRILPYAVTRRAFRSINASGHPAVFYLHPWEIDPEHPRIPLPARVALTHYFNLSATCGRLHRLLEDFRFAPMREVLGVG
jgi:polysaccharide deacetylase family protein (PEP-CTERM system associated)